jgi:hypothetical protein
MVASAAIVTVIAAVLVGAPSPASASSSQSAMASASQVAPSGAVKTADLSGFQPGMIISDAVFFNKGTMTEAQIQAFLQSKVPSCQAGYTCLKDKTDISRTTNADAMCGSYSGGVRESAARIIYKVAQACGINPQVILVTLQKEQGLVTHTWPSEWRYTIAMGQGCPDTAACDTRYYGFFNQVFGAAWQLKRYGNPPGTSNYFNWYAPGRTWNVRFHPNAACGSTPVYIQNQATANLYYYTPYQPNAAALRAGYAAANDPCSSYGNRNFYNYFTDWFGSTQNGPDPCAQPSGAKKAVKTYVVTAASLNARLAPNTACAKDAGSFSQGTVLQAVAVAGDWLKVHDESVDRWVNRAYLRYATAEEGACARPGGVGPAVLTYTVTTPTTSLRAAPDDGCGSSVVPVSGDTILKAVAVSADRQWVKVNAGEEVLWLDRADTRRASDTEIPCAMPGGVSSAKLHYVVRDGGTVGRSAPNPACGIGAATLSAGTVVQADSANGPRNWLRVSTGQGTLWVDRAQLAPATAAEACSAVPASRAAKNTYVVLESGATARSAPSTGCEPGSTALTAGTVVSPTTSTIRGDWLRVRLVAGERWVPRSSVRAATAAEACQVPVDTRSAQYTYIVGDEGATGRMAPHTGCADGAGEVAAGTIATAVAATAPGDWLLLALPEGQRWVSRASTTRYTAP